MDYDDLKEKKLKCPKLYKIGQLINRQLSPAKADELARNDEDTQVVMENKNNDFIVSSRKNRNRSEEQ